MRRKIYDELLKWKQEEYGSVAIMIDGARRVGITRPTMTLCSCTFPCISE